ncbi:MAG: carbon storage regulator CsrA [Negativicutes bacterium]|nr:carbon storage regulator CsrA [Negativicutes bacterium]
MLALTRKVGERIVIDDSIIVTVVDVKGDYVRLALEAPKNIKIYRGEIYDSIVAENQQAATPVDIKAFDKFKDIKKLNHL